MSSTRKSKVCSDLEWKDEVDAEERVKRKAASRRDSKAAKMNKKAKKENATAAASSADPAKKRGRPLSKSKGASSKQSIKRVREQRRQETKKAEEEEARKRAQKKGHSLDYHPGNIIAAALDVKEEDAAAPEDFFWEMESVIGRRIKKGRVEYLIRWKGCTEEGNTWEPTANLCDTAMEEATNYTKALKLKEKKREEDERKLFGAPDDETNDCIEKEKEVIVIDDEPNENAMSAKNEEPMAVDPIECVQGPNVVEDNLWKWSEADQVVFRDVERIDINDPNAAKIVTDARINGTPLVLVGHVGWANFAKRWLSKQKVEATKKQKVEETKKGSQLESNSKGKSEGGGVNPLLDPMLVDLTANIAEVAKEKSPEPISIQTEQVGERTEVDSIAVHPSAKPSAKEEETKVECNASPSDDLLDLSKQNYTLDLKKMIKDIGDEDVPVIKRHYNEEKPIHGKIAAEKFLTTCWPTAETIPQEEEKPTKKNSTNLYLHQWQFPLSDTAGRKLCHQSNPLPKGIMGEDLLKYWLDLPQCKLDSPLQYIFMGREDTLSKLHRDPGGLEISIAPIVGQKECVLVHRADGSNCLYHLNASLENIDLQRHPLLSQARTWRTVIQPGEILLMPYGTYHQCRNLTPCLSYSRFHLDTVNLLPFVQSLVNGDAPEIDHAEVLWNLSSELIKRVDGVFDEVQTRIKAGRDEGDLINDSVVETVNTLRTLRHFVREVARREEIRQIVKCSNQGSEVTKNSEEHDFGMLCDDVDMCLHEFRYRQSRVVPPFKARRGKALKNTLSLSSGARKDVIKRDMSKFGVGVVAFNTSLENNYMSLVNADVGKRFPNAAKDKVGETLIGELVPGDKISVQLEQKHVKSEVVEILPQLKSAYLSFEDYPSVYDEYQPCSLLRLPTGAEIPPEDVKPGLVVIDLSNSNEYRAKIVSTMNGPMARVKLIVSQHEMTRLVSPDMILGRYVPPNRKSKKTNTKNAPGTTAVETKEASPPIMRPTEAGQVVEVGRRGAASVMKVHGSPPTHVDVRFILGTANSESMVPIENVQLAPELNPEAGRGRRKASRKSSSSDKDISPPDGSGTPTGSQALISAVPVRSPSTVVSSVI